MPFPFKGLKKKPIKSMYQIRDIDPDIWNIFKSKCQLQGKTVKEVFHEFIERSCR